MMLKLLEIPRCNTFLTDNSKSLVPSITLRTCRSHILSYEFLLVFFHYYLSFLDLLRLNYLLFISVDIVFPCKIAAKTQDTMPPCYVAEKPSLSWHQIHEPASYPQPPAKPGAPYRVPTPATILCLGLCQHSPGKTSQMNHYRHQTVRTTGAIHSQSDQAQCP